MQKSTAHLGLGGEGISDNIDNESDNPSRGLNPEIFPDSLDALTEKLIIIADWRDELRQELGAAINDVWGPFPDLDRLRLEVERFKLGCLGARS